MKRSLLILLFSLMGTTAVHAQSNESFAVWIQNVEQEAAAEGISAETAHAALSDVVLDDHIIELDNKQPETTITFAEYVKRTVTPDRVRMGRELLQENAAMLNAVSAHYGVPAPVIVALWGIESSYGQRSGDYVVVNSLATLAYRGRRADFFRKELMNALRILDQQHISSSNLLGSWAGAMGQCQFMPSTYLHYAASYTGGSGPDIWNNNADVFASIANYLAAEGWHADEDWGHEVRLKHPISEQAVGLTQARTLNEWGQMGVDESRMGSLQADGSQAAYLVAPDGADGRHFLVYDNFRALMRWNRSTFFATSVGLLADRISDVR